MESSNSPHFRSARSLSSAQKQLGKDAELAAAEVVRRAERGLGIAVKRGQAAGTVNTPADGGRPPSKNSVSSAPSFQKVSPKDIFEGRTQERRDSYDLAAADEDTFENGAPSLAAALQEPG